MSERLYRTTKGWAFVHLDAAEEVTHGGLTMLGVPVTLAGEGATTIWVEEREPMSVLEQQLDYWLERFGAERVTEGRSSSGE